MILNGNSKEKSVIWFDCSNIVILKRNTEIPVLMDTNLMNRLPLRMKWRNLKMYIEIKAIFKAMRRPVI